MTHADTAPYGGEPEFAGFTFIDIGIRAGRPAAATTTDVVQVFPSSSEKAAEFFTVVAHRVSDHSWLRR